MANIMLSRWYRLYSHQTPAERAMELAVSLLGVPYRFNHPFLAQKVFADFSLPYDGILIEVDGASHRKKGAPEADMLRDELMRKHGWETLRVTNEEVLADPFAALNRLMLEANLPYRCHEDAAVVGIAGGLRDRAQRRFIADRDSGNRPQGLGGAPGSRRGRRPGRPRKDGNGARRVTAAEMVARRAQGSRDRGRPRTKSQAEERRLQETALPSRRGQLRISR